MTQAGPGWRPRDSRHGSDASGRAAAQAGPRSCDLCRVYGLAPVEVPQVPIHGPCEPAGQVHGGSPVKLVLDASKVYGVAPVVPRTVLHVLDELLMGTECGVRAAFVQEFANGLHDREVRALAVAAHVVGLSQRTLL